jgi:hypothetical protein
MGLHTYTNDVVVVCIRFLIFNDKRNLNSTYRTKFNKQSSISIPRIFVCSMPTNALNYVLCEVLSWAYLRRVIRPLKFMYIYIGMYRKIFSFPVFLIAFDRKWRQIEYIIVPTSDRWNLVSASPSGRTDELVEKSPKVLPRQCNH